MAKDIDGAKARCNELTLTQMADVVPAFDAPPPQQLPPPPPSAAVADSTKPTTTPVSTPPAPKKTETVTSSVSHKSAESTHSDAVANPPNVQKPRVENMSASSAAKATTVAAAVTPLATPTTVPDANRAARSAKGKDSGSAPASFSGAANKLAD